MFGKYTKNNKTTRQKLCLYAGVSHISLRIFTVCIGEEIAKKGLEIL